MIDNCKCKIGYYHTPGNNANLANKDYIDKPPIWYSVDMSDWN